MSKDMLLLSNNRPRALQRWIFLYVLFNFSYSFAQSSQWEISIGPSLTNTIHSVNGQQVVWAFAPHSPQYKMGWSVGFGRRNRIWNGLEVRTGIELKSMGDRLSMQTFNPDSIYGLDLLYAALPVDVLIRVLQSRQLYITPGFSIDVLLKSNALAWWVQNAPILTARMGIGFQAYRDIYVEIDYAESISRVFSVEFDQYHQAIRHQSFTLSLIARL